MYVHTPVLVLVYMLMLFDVFMYDMTCILIILYRVVVTFTSHTQTQNKIVLHVLKVKQFVLIKLNDES